MKVRDFIEMFNDSDLDKEIRFGATVEIGRSLSGFYDGDVVVEPACVLEENIPVLTEDLELKIDENIIQVHVSGDEVWEE